MASRRPNDSAEAPRFVERISLEERAVLRVLRVLSDARRSNLYQVIAEVGRGECPDLDALAVLARSVALLCVVLGSG